ncbi:hypothetical protein GX48_00228 [Paracoccidioides brasiliensis]|nr:hypothetical protein GX48_00228 [Paracoccidioides brasiliensis]
MALGLGKPCSPELLNSRKGSVDWDLGITGPMHMSRCEQWQDKWAAHITVILGVHNLPGLLTKQVDQLPDSNSHTQASPTSTFQI